MAPSDSAPALAQHISDLYPLARVLVGSDEADALLRRVYERAATVPPQQRPSDEREWLFRLTLEAREGGLPSTGAELQSATETSFTDDPFRREVAEHTAQRMLPVAFAACSLHERIILAIDVLATPSDEALAAVLDTTPANARSVRDRARSALRASLRDILTGPERMLVDVALSDDTLHTHLRDLLTERFQPPPGSLRSTVVDILERAQEERDSEPPASPSLSLLKRGRTLLKSLFSVKGVAGIVFVLFLLAAAIGGESYFSTSPSPSPRSILGLSVENAADIRPTYSTQAPAEATAYIRRTWNRHVSPPSLEGTTLQGVGRLEVDDDGEVPVLLYTDDQDGRQIAAFAFNYALLDRLGDRATLERQLRTKLAANESLLPRQRSNQAIVLWRQRDDIFILVAPKTNPDTLRSRIRL